MEQDRTADAVAQPFTSDAAGLADASFKIGDLHIDERERVSYTRERILQIREDIEISEDILKVKQLIEAEFDDTKSEDLYFQGRERICYSIDQLLRLQKVAKIPEDILKIKKVFDVETKVAKIPEDILKIKKKFDVETKASASPSFSDLSGSPPEIDNLVHQMEDCTWSLGQSECTYFMKFGTCKFGSTCKYKHTQSSATTGSSLADGPVQRPSHMDYTESCHQSDCPYFMEFGTCKFGSACKYQHCRPLSSDYCASQMYGPIPRQSQMEEYPLSPGGPVCLYFIKHGTSPSTLSYLTTKADGLIHHEGQLDEYPQRPGEPECSYFIKHGTCKFRYTCKFHHPSPSTLSYLTTKADGLIHHEGQLDEYPQRPGEPECSYFVKHGTCKFKSACKFHHPSPSTLSYQTTEAEEPIHHEGQLDEYPQRPGEPECSYFMKHGTCKFGYSCKFHHPASSTLGCLTVKVDDPVHREQMEQHPQRPECSYFIKYGTCKFESACKFHHPSPTTLGGLTTEANDWVRHQGHMGHSEIPGEADCLPTVPLCIISPAGLPLRPGRPTCSYYSRFGTCKFGPQCRFDHPYG